MKFLNAVIALLFFNSFFYCQVQEDFTDGDFSYNPEWSGAIGNFIVNSSGQLQSYNTIASYSFLTTEHHLTTIQNKEWNFWVKLSFSPSSNNNARIYLTSDNTDLSIKPDGYFLQLGETGALDAVRLMKSENGIETEVCASQEGEISSAFAISIKVVRDAIGNWKLYIDYSGGDNYENPAIGYDSSMLVGTSTGFYCKYTISNTSKFYFDDIYVGDIQYDTVPPSIENAKVIFDRQIDLLFNESLDNSSANNISNYTLQPSTTISGAQIDNTNNRLVHLTLSESLINGESYWLNTNQINDLEGNNKQDSISFTYRVAEIPERGDVIFTEIMSDPSPSFGLPEVEYLEVYNRSQKYFDLDNWKIKDASSTGTINSAWLNPGEYAVICSSTNTDEFPEGIPCTSFPNLNNNGDYIGLLYSDGTIIDDLAYIDDWIDDVSKVEGGFSLERKNIGLKCFQKSNWGVSDASLGGTPGTENSIFTQQLDEENPFLISAILEADNLLKINFNEPIDSLSILEENILLSDGLTVEKFTVPSIFSDTLVIQLSESIQPKIEYEVELIGVGDCSNNSSDLAAYFVLPELPVKGDIVINELLFNPSDGGSDYIEIYNSSDKYIDLKSWDLARWKDGNLDEVKLVASNFILKPNAYSVFTEDTSSLVNFYPKSSGGNFIEQELPSMNNDSGTIVLSFMGLEMDKVSYQSNWHLDLLDDLKGKALEKIDPFGISTSSFNWRTAAAQDNYGTPSYRNSQLSNAENKEGLFEIVYETVTPNNDGVFDYLEISYQIDEPSMYATFSIYDKTGRLVKVVFDKEVLGQEGILIWDVFNSEQQLVESGSYVAVLEAFSENSGLTILKKKAFVVYKEP
jgi:hypothetical protein